MTKEVFKKVQKTRASPTIKVTQLKLKAHDVYVVEPNIASIPARQRYVHVVDKVILPLQP